MLIIKNGILHTMTSDTDDDICGSIVIDNGKILKIINGYMDEDFFNSFASHSIINADGLHVYPGFIEAHCHIGITEAKMGKEGDDCNENVNPITPWLRAIDAINPMDTAFSEAVRAGITSVMAGPGSSNVVGGQFMVLKTGSSGTNARNISKLTLLEPSAMKAAFGENPKFTYGPNKSMPSTRMGVAGLLREELSNAKAYCDKRKHGGEYDFRLEAWVNVFDGKIPLKTHVHRADDIMTAIRIAKEFGISLTLDHCSEGHLIAEEIAKSGFPAIVGPDLASRNKIEVRNAAFKTAGILHNAGVLTAITTDHPVSLIQTLPFCAGLAAKCGLGKYNALKAITINAARICRTDKRTGSLEEGKDADIAIFDGFPLEIFTNCIYTIIDGNIVYNYNKEKANDFNGASPQFV